MKINIETIGHQLQRYDTCGDYWNDPDGTEQIRVSNLPDPKMEKLISIHEMIEKFLVECKGIDIKTIDDFDINFERERALGLHDADEECGFDPSAPYFKEHAIATKIERMLAREVGVDWNKYSNEVNNL